jgi:hypothetical protein
MATGGDKRVYRTTLASACSGGGDRRGGAEHQTRLSIVFVKWSLLDAYFDVMNAEAKTEGRICRYYS